MRLLRLSKAYVRLPQTVLVAFRPMSFARSWAVAAVIGAGLMGWLSPSRSGVTSWTASPTASLGEPNNAVSALTCVFQRFRITVASSRSDSESGPRRKVWCRARLWCRLMGG